MSQQTPRSVWGLILSDLKAKSQWCYERADWKGLLKVLLTDGTASMILYRLMQWARRWRLGPLEMVFNKLNGMCCSCIIGRGAEFGPEFVFIHSQGVFINAEVRGGSRVFIEHQVTIGADMNRQSPVLGNDIYVGAGAKIVGGITIADGAQISANSVVLHDVPAGAIMFGMPARVVRFRDPSTISNPPPG